jgi:hypothetical protein
MKQPGDRKSAYIQEAGSRQGCHEGNGARFRKRKPRRQVLSVLARNLNLGDIAYLRILRVRLLHGGPASVFFIVLWNCLFRTTSIC